MFYSKFTRGFYPASMRAEYEAKGTLPNDIVEITVERRQELAVGEAAGKLIVAGADGRPELADPPPTPLPVLIEAAKEKVRTMRAGAFASLAGIQSQALANGDTTTAKAISGLQDMLKVLPDIDLSGCKTQADIEAAFTAAWLAVVAAAPANVANAFNGVQP